MPGLFRHTCTSIRSVPAAISTSPHMAFTDSFSLSTMQENATVTNMLSLSMGTTTLARPSRSAL